MYCLEANSDSPIIELRQGLPILRAGEIAQTACQSLLRVTAGHGPDQGTAGPSKFCQNHPPTTIKHQNQPIKQNERKKKIRKKAPLPLKKKINQWLKLKSYQQTDHVSLLKGVKCGKAFQPYPRQLDPRGVQCFPRPATPSSRYSRETNRPIPFPFPDPGAKGDWQASSLPPGGKQQILGTQDLLGAETSVG